MNSHISIAFIKKLKQLWQAEEKRQEDTISLIPSENIASDLVRLAMGSKLTNKYSEGYPGKRYYPGNVYYDEIEKLCQQLTLKVFNLSPKKWSANVQPYSGSPANLAIYFGLMRPNDVLMGMQLASGGHLTHGHKVSASGIIFKSVQYGVGPDGLIDYKEIEKLALKYKPKIIIGGSTAYPRKIDFKKFSSIAKKTGAYLMADIAHLAGLIATKNHPNCFPWCDVAMFTTHKNFRGPRGAIIICRKELEEKINRAVFPALQGGPHNNQILAKAIALAQALEAKYQKEQNQVIINARVLAQELTKLGFNLFAQGTDNHLMLIDLSKSNIDASWAEKQLEQVGILANRNSLPSDDKPFKPSGLRLGSPSATARGMKAKEMKIIAQIIYKTLHGQDKLADIKKEVKNLAERFIYQQ